MSKSRRLLLKSAADLLGGLGGGAMGAAAGKAMMPKAPTAPKPSSVPGSPVGPGMGMVLGRQGMGGGTTPAGIAMNKPSGKAPYVPTGNIMNPIGNVMTRPAGSETGSPSLLDASQGIMSPSMNMQGQQMPFADMTETPPMSEPDNPLDAVGGPSQPMMDPAAMNGNQALREYPAYHQNRYQAPATQKKFWDQAYDSSPQSTLSAAQGRIAQQPQPAAFNQPQALAGP